MTTRTSISIICIWFSFMALLVLGIVMVASAGLCAPVPAGQSASTFLHKQSGFALLGLAVAVTAGCVNYHMLRRWVKPLWWTCVVLLVLCYIPSIGMQINGESRWINLGISFQPSEYAQLTLMVCLAHWYTTRREMAGTFVQGFVIPGIIFGIPLMLILFEKDMGTSAALAADDTGDAVFTAPVSTGRAGVGCGEGSGRTPTGRFAICSKHGENAPLHTVFRGRIPVGVWPACGGEDAILARILCLDGLDAANANTRARYIYLHGTAETALLGTPASRGCIRLSPQDAATLFDLAPLGTLLTIN